MVQLPGGNLQQLFAEGVAVLGHRQHVVLPVQGQDGHAARVVHHLPGGGPAIGQLHRVHMDGDDPSGEFVLPAELPLGQVHLLAHVSASFPKGPRKALVFPDIAVPDRDYTTPEQK